MYKNLIKELKDKGISKEDLANLIGKSYKTVNEILNGKSTFNIDEAFMIKSRLFPKLDLNYLFKESN